MVELNNRVAQKEWQEYQKLNAATVMDAFLLPFTDGVLDVVVDNEIYNFFDGFSGVMLWRVHYDKNQGSTCIL